MTPSNSELDLQGIVPPMVTPLTRPDVLDVAGLERLIEHLVAGGVHALFVLGTTGESACLSQRLRREVLQRTCVLVGNRIPLVIGISDTAIEESVKLGLCAAESGADAVVVAPPFVMPPGQAELRLYLQELTARVPLPLLLYNCPPLTRTLFDIETVRWAMDQPRIIGIKDSSGNLGYFDALCALLPRRPSWRILAGPEELLATTMRMGGHGGVCGGANVFPRLYVKLFEAVSAGNAPLAEELQAKVVAVGKALYQFENHATSFIKGLKCALAFRGVCGADMASPFVQLPAEKRQVLKSNLDKLIEQLREEPVTTPVHPA